MQSRRVTAFIGAVLFIFAFISLSNAAEWTGECVGVSDGDTISVMHDGKAEKIRLYGVDCPESRQAFGERAKEFTAELVFRKMVSVTPVDRDRYGRTVGLVTRGDVLLNRALIDAGLAWVYGQYCKIPECGEWKELEKAARQEGRGLWSQPDPTPPWLWRRGGGNSDGGSAQSGGAYHGNTQNRVFHQASCRAFDCKHCTAVFADRDEALRAGYRPCGTCKP